jgi:DNA sulfur modification protein DndD
MAVASRFIPKAGSQVILFATNTEITRDVRQELGRHICREIVLKYDGASGVTASKEVLERS